jgi:antitoxin component YwqK of YwqJK toxin-antitoxin module
MYYLLYVITLSMLFSSPVFGADLFSNSTADPRKGILEIHMDSHIFFVNLHSIEHKITKYPNGSIKFLSFEDSTYSYDVFFYPRNYGREKIALFKRFAIFNGQRLLDGSIKYFSQYGNLITQTGWSLGILHGKSLTYNEFNRSLIKDNTYDQGLPTKTWTTYYPNGKKASETTFPNSKKDWKKTRFKGNNSTNSIVNQTFPNPIELKQKWFNQSGILIKELTFYVFLNNNKLNFLNKKQTKTFYASHLIKNKIEKEGKGLQREIDISLDKITISEQTWLNSLLFKEVNIDIESPNNENLLHFIQHND